MYVRIVCIGLGLAAVVLAACSSEGPPTAGAQTDFTSVCAKANDGHRVAVDGFLRLPDTIDIIRPSRSTSGGTEIVVVRLFQTGKFQGTPIGVNIDFGDQPNTMEVLPTTGSYTDEDLKVRTADGQVAGFGQKVHISGTVYFPTALATDIDFDCGLNNPLVEAVN